MDFWNRRKVKDLETRLNIAESKNRGLQKQIEKLEAKLSDDRVCDGYCENCKHGIQDYASGIRIGPPVPYYKCALNCKCKDFERKEWTLFDGYEEQATKAQINDNRKDML